MTIWQILLDPWRAQSEMGRLKGYKHTVLELNNDLNWLQEGPDVKKVDGGWVCRFYPLNVQPVWPTLREAIRYGRESE